MSSAASQGRSGEGLSARGISSSPTRARSASRGSRGPVNRGRGSGRGGSDAAATNFPSAQAAFRGQVRGTSVSRASRSRGATNTRGHGPTQRASTNSARRARGSVSQTFNTTPHLQPETPSRPSSPAPGSVNMEEIEDRLSRLKSARELRKKQLISDGLIADPDKKTTLDNAITPVGSCTQMCPELERIQRIRERATDPAERINVRDGRGGSPSESMMVKRFRRSAAGNEEQLPEDIRTPETLQKTLDYLLNKIIGGGDRLATHQKYVWDRTRAIRNDFSIQQVTRPEDVKIAVDCYERIARFHILCLHLLSNDANTNPDEKFEAHQEREQLNNTFLSLMYYYDDNRHGLDFPNEAEFRAYCVLFELQSLTPDLEDRMQSWPSSVLNNPKVQTALKLYTAAGNTEFALGPLRPYVPASVAQADSAKFWTILHSPRVSYMMACVAEMNFSMVRFTALDAVWRSAKRAPERQQATMRSWTVSDMTDFLGFDDQQQTEEFLSAFGVSFISPDDGGEEFVNFKSLDAAFLDKSLLPSKQIYSESAVEIKRCHRTVVAVINGISVAEAVRRGLVEEYQGRDSPEEMESQSMFFPANDNEQMEHEQAGSPSPPLASFLNAQAPAFVPTETPASVVLTKESVPKWMSNFGAQDRSPDSPTAPIKNIFGRFDSPSQPPKDQQPSEPEVNFRPSPSSTTNPISPSPVPSPLAGTAPAKPATTDNAQPLSQTTFTQSSASGPAARTFPVSDFQSSIEQRTVAAAFSTLTDQKPVFQPLVSKQQDFPKVTFENQDESQSQSSLLSGNRSDQPLSISKNPNFDSRSVFTPQHENPIPSTSSNLDGKVVEFSPLPKLAQSSQSNLPTQTSALPSFDSSITGYKDTTTDVVTTKPKPLSSSDTVTAPQSILKRPSLTDISFPQVSPSPVKETSPLTTNSLKHSTHASNLKQVESSEEISSSLSITTPRARILQAKQAPNPADIKAARTKLIENTALVGLTQRGGILESFIQHKLSEILFQIHQQEQEERHTRVIVRLKTQYLSRKYLFLWRDIINRKRLRKRSERRRRLLATSIKAEQDKQKRKEAELEEILEATRVSRQLQEQFREAKNQARIPETELSASMNPHLQAGRKRKSLTNSPQSTPSTADKGQSKHKRSKTLESSIAGLSSPLHGASSNRLASSTQGTPRSDHSLRQSFSSQRLDKTRTDYFRLKAMGIDPETPFIPDTAESLALRQRRQQEERSAIVARVTTRPSSASVPVGPAKGSDMSPPSQLAPRPKMGSQSTVFPTQPSLSPPSTDTFLQQLREANRAMSESAAWFKEQSVGLVKEVETLEEKQSLNASLGSTEGRPTLTSGLARSVNGHEYIPPNLRPGQTLSRTELRIRQTGARGLAHKPIGGSPRPDNIGSNTSRRSYLSQSYSPEDNSRGGSKKRTIGEVDDDLNDTGHRRALSGDNPSPQHVWKKSKNNSLVTSMHHPFSASSEDAAEESSDEESLNNESFQYHNGADADGEIEEEGEEDFDELEEDEEEIDEEAVTNGHYYAMGSEERVSDEDDDDDDRPTTKQSTHSISTPASGPGFSVDDAIELSD